MSTTRLMNVNRMTPRRTVEPMRPLRIALRSNHSVVIALISMGVHLTTRSRHSSAVTTAPPCAARVVSAAAVGESVVAGVGCARIRPTPSVWEEATPSSTG